MPDPTQFDPAHLRVALGQGDSVDLDGATLLLGGHDTPSVLLRLSAPRARSVARILDEWIALSRTFTRPARRPYLDELELSRTLELAATVLDGTDEPPLHSPRGTRAVTHRQRLSAVAVLGAQETHLNTVQRLAVIDAAAWWLTDPHGGDELAYALLGAVCTGEITTEHVYLTLITPDDEESGNIGSPSE